MAGEHNNACQRDVPHDKVTWLVRSSTTMPLAVMATPSLIASRPQRPRTAPAAVPSRLPARRCGRASPPACPSPPRTCRLCWVLLRRPPRRRRAPPAPPPGCRGTLAGSAGRPGSRRRRRRCPAAPLPPAGAAASPAGRRAWQTAGGAARPGRGLQEGHREHDAVQRAPAR